MCTTLSHCVPPCILDKTLDTAGCRLGTLVPDRGPLDTVLDSLWEGGNMARRVRDSSLETRAARLRLKPRGKPYYRSIEPGLHLGYRKTRGAGGKWVARHYIGAQNYQVETIATADDFSDADGVAILSFAQAQKAARKRMVVRVHSAAGKSGRPI